MCVVLKDVVMMDYSFFVTSTAVRLKTPSGDLFEESMEGGGGWK